MGFVDFLNDLIGPSSKYCVVFQIFTVIYLIGILIYVGSFLALMFKGKLKTDISISLISATTVALLCYHASRLMYGLCLTTN